MAALRAATVLLVSLSLASTARATCGDGRLDEGEECDDGNTDRTDGCDSTCFVECTEVGKAATEHTCLHGAHGPFANRVATASPEPPAEDVNDTHTYFTIALPDGGESTSSIRFTPTVSGDYAMYLKEQYPVRVLDAAGETLPVVLEHAIDSCSASDSIRWVRVYRPLVAGTDYVLELGPWSGATVSLALESLGFTSRLYRDADHDGFGARGAPAAEAWCTPPRGYSKAQGDCDDADAETHPGAPEACDGRNTDCDANDDTTETDLCEQSAAGGACFEHGGTWSCGCREDIDCSEPDTCVQSMCVTGGMSPADAGRGNADAGIIDPPETDAGAPAPPPSEAGAPSPAPDGAAPGSGPASHDSAGSCGSCRLTGNDSERAPGFPLVLSTLALLLALDRRRTTCRTSEDAKGSADGREASLADSR